MSEGIEYILRARDMLSGVINNAARSADNLGRNVDESNRKFSNLTNRVPGKIERLTAVLAHLKNKQQQAFDDKHIARYNVLIQKTQGELNRLNDLPPKSFIERMKQAGSSTNSLAGSFRTLVAAVGAVALIRSSESVYKDQVANQTKLQTVMRNTMDASRDQVDSIVQLARAQEKAGVVSETTQLGGAQELATYLSKSDSLKTLMPVMNDMIAQQYGLNSTQEQAVQIATMMGKVMDGQVGALSRYGYAFDEQQERILKFGNEEERAAVLADVISTSVGGMNAALSATPEGRLQQVANETGAIQGSIGDLVVKLKLAMVPIMQTGLAFVQNYLMPVFEWVGKNADMVATLVIAVLSGVAAFKAIRMAMAAWSAITQALTAAQWLLNVALNANPIGLIIAGISVLVGLIVLAIKKFDSFGATLMMLAGPGGWIINAIVLIKRHWDSIVNAFKGDGIVAGIRRIGEVLLDAVLYPVQQLLGVLAKIPKVGKWAASGAASIDRLRERMNLKTDAEKKTTKEDAEAGAPSPQEMPYGYDPGKAIGAIAGGGAKATNITINLNREMVGHITINPVTMTQGASEIKDLLMETLSQVLNSANRVAFD